VKHNSFLDKKENNYEDKILKLYKQNSNKLRVKIKNRLTYCFHRKIEGFDEDFYLLQVPSLKEAKMNPLKHYILYGTYEGIDPNSEFSNDTYILENLELLLSAKNPLIHFNMSKNNKSKK
jgi:hypothetical protein